VSQNLCQIQQGHFDKINSRRSSLRWTSAFIRQLWATAWDQWKHRIKVVHGRGPNQSISSELDHDIRMEWDRGRPPACPAHYRSLFRGTLDRILALPINEKSKWLQTTLALRHALDP